MRRIAFAMTLAACTPQGGVGPAPAGLTLDSGGIQPAGTNLRVDFGRAEAGTIAAVSRLVGAQPQSIVVQDDCGPSPMRVATWPNGLTLAFTRAGFVGWSQTASARAPATATGLRPGDLAPPGVGLRATRLGQEFSSDGISGLVSEGRVERLWAGRICSFG